MMRKWERARAVPDEMRRKVHELGLGLIDVPEALGGAGASLVTAVVAHEELAFGDPGAAVALLGPHVCAAAILELGSAAQAERFIGRFAGGSEAALRVGAVAWSEHAAAGRPLPLEGFATTAQKTDGGYLLHGSKAFVVNGGRADLTVVFAQVEPGAGWDGIGAFVVEGVAGPAILPGGGSVGEGGDRQAAGLTAGPRYELLGLQTVHAAPLTLDGVFVPDESRLAPSAPFAERLRRFFARVSLVTAARQVGLARASYECALAYTQERRAFGKPVAHFQAIAFTLADMHMDVEAARWMLWRAAAELDGGEGGLALVPGAAQHANEAAWRVADNGVQLLGGAGYIQDFPVEKWLRDTKALALFAPTDQLLALASVSALSVPGAAFFPGSALQPIFT